MPFFIAYHKVSHYLFLYIYFFIYIFTFSVLTQLADILKKTGNELPENLSDSGNLQERHNQLANHHDSDHSKAPPSNSHFISGERKIHELASQELSR